MVLIRATLLALLIPAAVSFRSPVVLRRTFGRSSPSARPSALVRRLGAAAAAAKGPDYSERDLKKMSLAELKSLAGSLRVAETNGHKGHKATWVAAILAHGEGGGEAAAPAPAAAAGAVAKSPEPAAIEEEGVDEFGDGMEGFFAAFPDSTDTFVRLCRPGAPAEAYLKASAEGCLLRGWALPGAPQYSDRDLGLLSDAMDFLQTSLLTFGDEEADPEEDPDFIAEGRKILSLDRFVVGQAWAEEKDLVEAIFTELGYLVGAADGEVPLGMDPSEALEGETGGGALLLAPGFSGGDVRSVLAQRVEPALGWLGLATTAGAAAAGVDLKGYRMSEGAPCPMVRVLYQVETAAVEYAPGEGPSEAAFAGGGGNEAMDGNAMVRELAAAIKADAEAEEEQAAAAAAAAAAAEVAAPAAATAAEAAEAAAATAEEEEPQRPSLSDLLMNGISDSTLNGLL